MNMVPVTIPLQFLTDLTGKPLENGQIFIGTPGLEARSSPKASFFDMSGTIPTGTASGAAIRTRIGYPINASGQIMPVLVNGDFSITVLDKLNAVVYTSLSANTSPYAQAEIFNNVWRDDVATLTADTTLTYGLGFGQVSVGGYVLTRKECRSYQVVASGAGTYDLITAGGVKLLLRTSIGNYPDAISYYAGKSVAMYNLDLSYATTYAGGTATKGTIRRAQPAGREELVITAAGTAFDAGSNGSGVSFYGNADTEHAGETHFMTGAAGVGTSRLGITQAGAVVAGYNVYGWANDMRLGDDVQVGYMNVRDNWGAGFGADPKVCYWAETDASTNGAVGTMRAKIGIGWREGTQNLHTGEGVSLGYYARLSLDTSPTLVAEIGIEKINTDDFSRASDIVFKVSTDGALAPAVAMKVKTSGVLNLSNVPTYASNALALAGSLVIGDVFKFADGSLKIVI